MASAFYLYPIAVFLLTLYHYFPYNLGSFINGVIYALLCFEIFGVLYIVNNLYGVKRTVSSLFNISLIIFVVNCSTVLLMSRNISNATSVYFIGTKFSTSYFNLAIICFWIIIYNKNKLLHRIVLVIISLIGLYCDVYMYSYTGLSMKLVVFGILIIRDFTSVKKKNNKAEGLLNFLRRPFVFVISMLLAGGIAIFLEQLLNRFTQVRNIITFFGKDSTILSRLQIYSNLVNIVKNKLLLGYGYESMIVSNIYGVNPQNGLFRSLIFFGAVGTVCFLVLIFFSVKDGVSGHSNDSDIILYCLYGFIVASIVEISFNFIFFILLSIYKNMCDEIIMKERIV